MMKSCLKRTRRWMLRKLQNPRIKQKWKRSRRKKKRKKRKKRSRLKI